MSIESGTRSQPISKLRLTNNSELKLRYTLNLWTFVMIPIKTTKIEYSFKFNSLDEFKKQSVAQYQSNLSTLNDFRNKKHNI